MPDWFKTFAAALVLLVWVACVVAGFLRPDYAMPHSVEFSAMVLVGALFATGASGMIHDYVNRNRARADKDDPPHQRH